MPERCTHEVGQVWPASRRRERLTFRVEPVPPFRLDLTVQALRRRTANAVDRWDGATYRRLLVVDQCLLEVEIAQLAPSECPLLQVTVSSASLPPSTRSVATSAITRLLGVDRPLDAFYDAAAADPGLNRLAQRFKGLKPPRFPTVFETLINAFACQQVTLNLGIQLLNRLAASCAGGRDGALDRAWPFPSPDDLAGRTADELRSLGFSRRKGMAIIELARAVASRRFHPAELEGLDDAAAIARLRSLRGVGRWTAEYVLLRGLGRLHVFPGDDIGARNNLQRWLGILEPLDYTGVQRVLAPWQPFQGLVYLHLLLWGLHSTRAEPTTGAGGVGGRALR